MQGINRHEAANEGKLPRHLHWPAYREISLLRSLLDRRIRCVVPCSGSVLNAAGHKGRFPHFSIWAFGGISMRGSGRSKTKVGLSLVGGGVTGK